MFPYVFEVFGYKVGSYGVMMALGFAFGGWFFARELRRRGRPPELAWEVVLAAALGGIIGARLLAALERPDELIADPLGTLFSSGGLTWYGGFAGGAAAVIWYIRRQGYRLVEIADAATPSLLLGYAFGRGGCQLAGDGCYGIETALPWGMAYPDGLVPIAVPVHPTPLYEIIYSLVGFAVVWLWLRKKPMPAGALFAWHLVYTAVFRFAVEFIRRNERYAAFSLSQWIALAILLFAAVWLFRLRGRPPLAIAGPDHEAAALDAFSLDEGESNVRSDGEQE